ncbi:hypothetical protein BOC41_12985 [Burkholderia pseudomallei]|nr:hypothetical protein BOC44_09770 [Burkholderia pseudomallei]OSP97178.1 hypothetical protein BOC41_12985 [Burkholderia pseudomallei]
MPLREVLFGVSVATLVPTTLVGSTLATSFHIVETVLGTRLPWTSHKGQNGIATHPPYRRLIRIIDIATSALWPAFLHRSTTCRRLVQPL